MDNNHNNNISSYSGKDASTTNSPIGCRQQLQQVSSNQQQIPQIPPTPSMTIAVYNVSTPVGCYPSTAAAVFHQPSPFQNIGFQPPNTGSPNSAFVDSNLNNNSNAGCVFGGFPSASFADPSQFPSYLAQNNLMMPKDGRFSISQQQFYSIPPNPYHSFFATTPTQYPSQNTASFDSGSSSFSVLARYPNLLGEINSDNRFSSESNQQKRGNTDGGITVSYGGDEHSLLKTQLSSSLGLKEEVLNNKENSVLEKNGVDIHQTCKTKFGLATSGTNCGSVGGLFTSDNRNEKPTNSRKNDNDNSPSTFELLQQQNWTIDLIQGGVTANSAGKKIDGDSLSLSDSDPATSQELDSSECSGAFVSPTPSEAVIIRTKDKVFKSDTEKTRYLERRHKNNEAAKNSRSKRRFRENELKAKVESLTAENTELKGKISEMERKFACANGNI